MSNNENMDNLQGCMLLFYTSDTNSMQASPRARDILVFFPAFFYKFMLFEFQVKGDAGTIDHAQNA